MSLISLHRSCLLAVLAFTSADGVGRFYLEYLSWRSKALEASSLISFFAKMHFMVLSEMSVGFWAETGRQ